MAPKTAPKLYEILAVENGLSAQADKVRADLQTTFDKKEHLFREKIVTFTPLKEDEPTQTREQSDIQSNVRDEIAWIMPILTKAWDAAHAVDIGNLSARANVVLEDGAELLKDIPATSLLQLAKRVQEVKTLITSIKTFDPAKGFTPDHNRPTGIYKARDVTKDSTSKITEFITAAPATKEHPAQVVKVENTVKVGTILEQEWSSLITPAEKADLLDRCEILARAIKQARSRANTVEVDTTAHKIGATLLGYIFQPLSI